MTPYEQKTLTYRIASFLLDNPKKSMLLGLLFLGALIPGLAKMKSDFSYRIWFRETDPLLAEFDQFERQFGNDEMVAVILYSPSGIFDVDSVKLLQDLTKDFWQVTEVIRVDSLANYNWTHSVEGTLMVEALFDDQVAFTQDQIDQRKEVALNHHVIPGYLVSKDGKAAVSFLQLKPAIGGTTQFEEVIKQTRETVAKYEGHGDHQFFITGPSAISNTFKEVTQADMKVMVPILIGAIVLFLLIFFRRFSGVAIPLFVIFASIFATLGFAGWVGIKFNNLTAIVPNILIAVSIADAVHILVTYFQFRGFGLERYEAAHATMVKNLLPTFLTSASTAIGFFSFAMGDIMPIVYMGILAGVGTMVAWVVTIFMVTPILPYLPGSIKASAMDHDHRDANPLMVRYTVWLREHSRAVLVAFALITIASAYIASRNEVNSDPLKYFAKDVHTRIANDFAEEHIGGMQAIEIVLDSGLEDGIKDPAFLAKVEKFDTWLKTLPDVTKTVSIIDIIKESNRSLNEDNEAFYVLPPEQSMIAEELFLYTMSLPQGMDLNNRMTLDNRKMRLSAMSNNHKSREMLAEIEVIEAKGRELGLNAEVTGKMPLYQEMNPYVVSGFTKSILMALVLVSLLMFAACRDWKLGLISMVPNVVPLVIGGAIMYGLGKSLDIGTVLVTSTCLGIAVDDTIHFLANYTRWRRLGIDSTTAIAHVLTHTGPALVVTTLVLVAGFGTFAFSEFVPNINFGILTAIVLTTALVADLTLLPAILLLVYNDQEQEATAPVGDLELAN